MQRRSLLVLTSLLPVGWIATRHVKAFASKPLQPTDYREQARRLNELAANIHTPADARMFVDFVADIFSEQLPPESISSPLLERVSKAEFLAATNPQMLISEWRVAQTWNTYVETIQAPEQCRVSPTEVHNLRDAFLAVAKLNWNRGIHNIWNVPAIYAFQPDGSLAAGCRAVECARLFWDLANMPDNLIAARVRVDREILVSDQLRRAREQPVSGIGHSYVTAGPATPNPVEVAEGLYVARNGMKALGHALAAMIDQALT